MAVPGVHVSISSMTGFARDEGCDAACSWTWEVKSVNGKGRDIRCRLPQGFDGLDLPARERAARRFRRGNITMTLTVVGNEGLGGYRINRRMLEQVIALLPEIRERFPDAKEPSAEGLLALRGVIEPAENGLLGEAKRELEADLLASLDKALDGLATMRGEEGARLAAMLGEELDSIEEHYRQAERLAAAQPTAIRARLEEQVAALVESVPALPEERLAQEAALLMIKADLREELDRLKAHIEAARDFLGKGEPVGRKLDFLCQELNREANTLCSKSADLALTHAGLAIKAAIEQFREQVQNIE
jgi:uncharacterized protein (TIGR00255 family)